MPFVRYDYATLDAYEGVVSARRSGSIDKGIVVMEEDKAIGILTPFDLARKQHAIVIDCLSEKPVVEKTDKIDDVLDLMGNSGHHILMVYDRENFVGTISQNDIIDHLNSNLNLQKLKVQSAAHDLKNPIASIKMIVNMLQDSLQLEENKQLVEYLKQSCDFAQKIVEDILLAEQISEEALVYTLEDFDRLVEHCLSHFSNELREKEISLSKDLNFGRMVRIDRSKFERAIHNLVSNSIKFSHSKALISISTAFSDDKLQLVVKDNGIGIPKNMQDRVFDRFTKARRTGTAGEKTTGLGMYITKQIIELHGGSIQLESEESTGTSLSIFLDVSQD